MSQKERSSSIRKRRNNTSVYALDHVICGGGQLYGARALLLRGCLPYAQSGWSTFRCGDS